jgi:spore maturation protein CgeB
MRILMTDSHNDRLLAHFYASHLKGMNAVEVGSLYYTDEMDAYRRSAVNRIAFRLYPKKILNRINKNIIDSIESFKPDVIWIFKGMEIYPETLSYAKNKGIKLVNYNPDHPFKYASAGSGNRFVKESIPLYDLHLSYSREILKQLKETYHIEGAYLPFGYEIQDSRYDMAVRETEVMKACFVGCADAERKRVVEVCVAAGIPVDVYGPDWDKYLKSSEFVQVYPGVYNDSLWNILRKYRMQLNVFRMQNNNSHNMRSFEIPGIGGIMLAPYSDEHIQFFEPGGEAFYFRNDYEISEKAKFIMSMPDADAAKIRNSARSRSVNDHYSYLDRSRMVHNYFLSLFD